MLFAADDRSEPMTTPRALLLLTTCPDATSAERISQTLVSEGLAACVGRLPGLHSTYRWQGRIEQAREYQLLIKASFRHKDALMERIVALHPYEVPELLILNVDDGLPAYLHWLDETSDTHEAE